MNVIISKQLCDSMNYFKMQGDNNFILNQSCNHYIWLIKTDQTRLGVIQARLWYIPNTSASQPLELHQSVWDFNLPPNVAWFIDFHIILQYRFFFFFFNSQIFTPLNFRALEILIIGKVCRKIQRSWERHDSQVTFSKHLTTHVFQTTLDYLALTFIFTYSSVRNIELTWNNYLNKI